MKSLGLMVVTGLLVVGCGRDDGRGANSPDQAQQSGGEKGVSSNFSATGNPLGPLGATQAFPRTIKTGTAAEILTNVQSVPPPQQQQKPAE